jgi:hypothetical protein
MTTMSCLTVPLPQQVTAGSPCRTGCTPLPGLGQEQDGIDVLDGLLSQADPEALGVVQPGGVNQQHALVQDGGGRGDVDGLRRGSEVRLGTGGELLEPAPETRSRPSWCRRAASWDLQADDRPALRYLRAPASGRSKASSTSPSLDLLGLGKGVPHLHPVRVDVVRVVGVQSPGA